MHDAFRVGEDGPTHQPIEQETQLRLLEKMANLEGRRSMLVLRPADVDETTAAWKIALETAVPCALLLTRQNVADLPTLSAGASRLSEAMAAGKGAYIVADAGTQPDIVLVADGSEVGTLLEGARILASGKNLKIRIVSAPSPALFLEQPESYRLSVLPALVPTLGLSAGLPDALQGLVGPLGKVIGLARFGASAPYKVLDEKFGYTAAHVVKHVDAYLTEYGTMVGKIAALRK